LISRYQLSFIAQVWKRSHLHDLYPTDTKVNAAFADILAREGDVESAKNLLYNLQIDEMSSENSEVCIELLLRALTPCGIAAFWKAYTIPTLRARRTASELVKCIEGLETFMGMSGCSCQR
jgi:hypothetical protein